MLLCFEPYKLMKLSKFPFRLNDLMTSFKKWMVPLSQHRIHYHTMHWLCICSKLWQHHFSCQLAFELIFTMRKSRFKNKFLTWYCRKKWALQCTIFYFSIPQDFSVKSRMAWAVGTNSSHIVVCFVLHTSTRKLKIGVTDFFCSL